MPLESYRAKRNFVRTPEPKGDVPTIVGERRIFVVHKHEARHLHYDFRLELGGVLLSWAVPKGPSLDPAEKRLAMHVEDHPLAYGDFEGTIPKGEYGGGTVMIWDRGTWIPTGDPKLGYAKGQLKFHLEGAKLNGGFALIRTRGSKYAGKSGNAAWLLIKEKDAHVQKGGGSILEQAPDSVLSGRTMNAIAQAPKAVVAKAKRGRDIKPKPFPSSSHGSGLLGRPEGAREARFPTRMAPQLATLASTAPAGTDWINEIKYDGYRILARIRAGKAQLFSRTGKDWTASFPEVADELGALEVERAWIDGEMVTLESSGRSSFSALQQALGDKVRKGMTFFVFDLPFLDDNDLRGVALSLRKARLRNLLPTHLNTVRMGPEIPGDAVELLRQACELGLEGIICKKSDSLYGSGKRSRDWIKVKCLKRQEMVVGGYTDPKGSRAEFGALLLGTYEDGHLRYAGKVGTGFGASTLRTLAERLRKLETPRSPFIDTPTGLEARGVHWVRPKLVAEIEFVEWSQDGALRHPTFQGLRMDKSARDVVREGTTAEVPVSTSRKRQVRGGAVASSLTKAATFTNPDKMYFPEAQVTKADVARYYEAVSGHLLPHLKVRPLSLLRCPEGWAGECFYQKNASRSVDAALQRIQVPTSRGQATYLQVDDVAGLVGLVQWGVIELHPWGSASPHLDRPDRLIFDFDPDEAIAWKELVAAVGLLRTLLGEIGLIGFLKTTGGKGLHVVVPIKPTMAWADAKAFTKSVADFLVRTFPDRFTTTLSKERRRGKIFIDYLRNAEGATAVAPYSLRARWKAPVATPIDWAELARDVRLEYFNVQNIPRRLARIKADPWADFFTQKQTVTAQMRKQFR